MNKFCQNALAYGPGLFPPHCLNGKTSAIVEFYTDMGTEIYYLCDYCSSKITAKARSKQMKVKVEYVELEKRIFKKITIKPEINY